MASRLGLRSTPNTAISPRIHQTLRITPAMAAGLSDHVWSLEEMVLMADSYLPKPGKRGSYKKKHS